MNFPFKVYSLTKRETEVASHLAHGLSKQQIAEKLSIGLRTVGSHCRSIKMKWRMNTEITAALQAEAKQRGYHLAQEDP
jgi:DNA-binding NarL/FixJ family response regulator